MSKEKTYKDIPIGGIISNHGNSRENKTGSWKNESPVVDQEKCIKCSMCVRSCPEKIMELNENKEIAIDYDYCKGCGICASICPKGAINMK